MQEIKRLYINLFFPKKYFYLERFLIYNSFFFLFFFFQLQEAKGQEYQFKFKVTDDVNNPMSDVAIQISSASIGTTGGYTDTLGVFTFNYRIKGEYDVLFSFIGYETLEQKVFLGRENKEQIFKLTGKNQALEGVTVTAMKKILKRKHDRLELETNGNNSLGNNAVEILKNAPGISITDNKISLLGNDVQVQVDGKPSKFTQAQLINYLANKNALQIKRIELINNTDASHDANLQGRIINIVTKKTIGDGYTLTLNAGLNQRSVHLSEYGGFNFHLRKNKLSFYVDGNYYHSKQREIGKITQIIENDIGVVNINEESQSDFSGQEPGYEVGIDYFLNDQSTFGLKLEGYDDKATIFLQGDSDINNNSTLDSIISIDDTKRTIEQFKNINVNYKTTLDTFGTSLNIDVDFGKIYNNFRNEQLLTTFLPNETFLREIPTFQRTESNNNLIGAKIMLTPKFRTTS